MTGYVTHPLTRRGLGALLGGVFFRPLAQPASDTTLTGNVTITGQLTVKQGTQMAGPVVINQDTGHDALQVNANANAPLSKQLFQASDHTGAPITSVPVTGGPAVYGDNFRVHHVDIFKQDVTLWSFGAITLNQRNSGVTIWSSAVDPNVTPPPNVNPDGRVRAYRNGDRCMCTYAPYPTLIFTNGTWQ